MPVETLVDKAESLAAALASRFEEEGRHAVATRGRFTVALARRIGRRPLSFRDSPARPVRLVPDGLFLGRRARGAARPPGLELRGRAVAVARAGRRAGRRRPPHEGGSAGPRREAADRLRAGARARPPDLRRAWTSSCSASDPTATSVRCSPAIPCWPSASRWVAVVEDSPEAAAAPPHPDPARR